MNKLTPYLLKMTSLAWYSAVVVVLAAGWAARDQRYLVAESGIGYWFGIIGGSMMLILLIYPLRKRFRRWSYIGSIKSWFRIHMILGIAGPLIVIFHSGFQLGSLNSSVAFFCMIIVALSGLVGRILYQKIHHGLYGRKVQFEEFYSNDDLPCILLNSSGDIDFELADEFEQIEEKLSHKHSGVNRSLGFYLSLKSRIGRLQRSVANSSLAANEKQQVYRRIKDLRSISSLGVNEILFSYWHVLHLPLFFMLILSGLIHVVVVHFY